MENNREDILVIGDKEYHIINYTSHIDEDVSGMESYILIDDNGFISERFRYWELELDDNLEPIKDNSEWSMVILGRVTPLNDNAISYTPFNQ